MIQRLCTQAHKTAKEKGWWDKPRTDLEIIALIHAELSEAVEAYRNGENHHIKYELADVIIRIFDYCEHNGWDLETALLEKMKFNETRPYRHGNKIA